MSRQTALSFKRRMRLGMLFLFGLVVAWIPANAQQQSTYTALALNTALANAGQPVTLTANVLSGNTTPPTGTVTFMDGTTTMGATPLNGGTATFTTSNLAAGNHSIYASYGGDSNNVASASYVHALVVSSTPVPVVTLTTTGSTVAQGTAFTLNASVAPYSGSTIPTGTVTFQDGSVVLGSAKLDDNGNASLTSNSTSAGLKLLLPVGVNTLYVSYSGDSTYAGTISSGVPVQVTSAAPQVQLIPGIITTQNINLFAQNMTTDLSGNVYYVDSNGVWVIASGNGKIPGVSNPVAGTTYALVSSSCGNAPFPCGIPGPATSAGIQSPGTIQVDAASNVYIIADGIFKIDAQTDQISQVNTAPIPALGSAPASGPALSSALNGLAVDNSGNLYISSNSDPVVLRVDALTGVLSLVAGTTGSPCTSSTTAASCGDGGLATNASISTSDGLYVDKEGNLYLTDLYSVREIDAKTGIINTIAGTFGVGCSSPNCGDGGPATQALFGYPTGVASDAGGNLYIADLVGYAVRKIDTQGNISTIAGIILQPNIGSADGDNGPATSALLNAPAQVRFDPHGNMYILTGGFGGGPIREVSAATTGFSYSAATIGPGNSQTVTVSNTTTDPLHITGITATTGFVQQPVGADDCTGIEMIAPGGFCTLGIAFYPPAKGTTTGSLSIADDSSNATGGNNVISLTGTSSNGGTSNTITFAALPNVTYGANPITLNATASSGNSVNYSVTGPATVSGSTLTIKGAGKVIVTAYQFGDGTYEPATPVSQSFTVMPAVLTVTANSFPCEAGQITSCLAANPLAYTVTGFVNGDTSAAVSGTATLTTTVASNSGTGTYPVTFVTENLTAANYTFTYVPGAVTVTGGESQTISFGALQGVTYGTGSITLNATASSGLPVAYTVTGPATISGSILSVTGAGVVTVTAQQGGNSTFAPATPVPQSFVVSKAVLTVTANSQTMAQGNTPGNFTASYAGFVNGDTSTVLTGAPAFTTPATASSPVGTQPLDISQGTLAAANYTFNFVNGVITIVTGTSQTITFPQIPAQTYGVGPISLFASSTSSLPVSYKVTGPATLSGSSTLNILGVGTVLVTASQPGQGIYSAASPVAQQIVVAPAVLTVTANSVSRVNNVPNPAFTATLSGFVNGDTSSSVGGNPAFLTTAIPGSPIGTYPITVAPGNLAAANYTFVTAPGTLTVTSGGPSPDFSVTAAPQVLTVSPGRTQITTLSLTPINYFLGTVSLSCSNLPANVTCIFTPAAFTADGTGNVPNYVTLTINTNSASPVVGQLKSPNSPGAGTLACFLFPAGGLILLLPIGKRRRYGLRNALQTLSFLMVLGGMVGLGGCGAGNNSGHSGLAAPGTSTFTVTATGSSTNATGPVSHNLQLTLTVLGPQ